MQRTWGRNKLVMFTASWKVSVARAESASRRQERKVVRVSIAVITIFPSFSSCLLKCFFFLWTLPSVYVGVCLGSVLDFIIGLSTMWMALVRHLPNLRQRSQVQTQSLSGKPVNWEGQFPAL